jgi:TRAP-type C4-dicarboxylate transport system substrate-binding protein
LFFGAFSFTPIAASQDKPIEIRWGYGTPTNSPRYRSAHVPWAKMAEEATHGKIKITHFPSDTLFKSKDALTAIQTGLGDVNTNMLSYFPGRFNLTEVVFLPFLLRSSSAEINSQIVQELYETTPEIKEEFSGMKLLFIASSDPYFIATAKKPMRNANDLKGMKIRATGELPMATLKGLGAVPVTISIFDTYEAASRGIIDGTLILNASLPDFKLYEVLHYWTDVALWTCIDIQTMNLNKWNSLPPDAQKGLMSASGVNGARFWGREAYGTPMKDLADAMIKKGGYKWEKVELDKGEIERWRETVGKPIWNKWVKDMQSKGLPGQKVLDKAIQLVEKYK